MTHNFNVKVKTGKRTTVEVEVHYTGADAVVEFAYCNGFMTKSELANRIAEILQDKIGKFGTGKETA
jgi:hypothetical protein